MTCPITADRDAWRGAEPSVAQVDYALLRALDIPASADNLLICAFHRQQAEASFKAREDDLRGALSAIIADTDCCAASKAIARDALAKGGVPCNLL